MPVSPAHSACAAACYAVGMAAKTKTGRITLTKSQAESSFGKRLIAQILAMSQDSNITIEEVWTLHGVLREGPVDIAAVPFLRAITTGILTDGQLDEWEGYELRRGMERIVPKAERTQLSALLEGIGMPSGYEDESTPSRARDWRRDPATERQIEYIINLGGEPWVGMTKGDASDTIEHYRVVRPPTPRQRMLLRFYDRCDLESTTKEEISVFIDLLYVQYPAYERAWHLYKEDVGHDNFSRDYLSVPIGAYRNYLREGSSPLNMHLVQAVPPSRPKSRRMVWLAFLVALVACIVVVMIAIK